MPSLIAEYLTHCLRLTIGYGKAFTADICAEDFAHTPHPGMNHPAFCLGHLSLYPNELLRQLGRQEHIVDRPDFVPVFQAGAPCVEQDGRYPPKHEITEFYLDRHYVLCNAIADAGDKLPALMQGSPDTPFRRWFPTIGAALIYYVNNHHMQHLGQISAWRRVMGLSPLNWGEPDRS